MDLDQSPSANTVVLQSVFVALLAIFAVSWGQVADPFVRHDDFPALLGDHEAYYRKTLEEGRWVNYWWTLRPWLWSSQVNYALYLSGWAVFAAAFAVNALGRTSSLIWRGALTVLIVLTPQAFNISQWYNTLVPGVWLLAAYALFCVYASWRTAMLLLLLFSPLVFSTYSTYPFLLLATLMTSEKMERSWRAYVVAGIVFAVSFALSLGMAYGLNWLNHGVFGIVTAEWRETLTPDGSISPIENLPLVSQFVFEMLRNYGLGRVHYGFAVYALVAFAFFIVFLNDRQQAVFAATSAILGMGLLIYYALTKGIFIPVRASIFVWICSAFLLVKAGQLLSGKARSGTVLSLVVIGSIAAMLAYRMVWNIEFKFPHWQTATAELASLIPRDVEKVVIIGYPGEVEGAFRAEIQSHKGLVGRIQYLTGIPTTICYELVVCGIQLPPFALENSFDHHSRREVHVHTLDGMAFVWLPTTILVP